MFNKENGLERMVTIDLKVLNLKVVLVWMPQWDATLESKAINSMINIELPTVYNSTFHVKEPKKVIYC